MLSVRAARARDAAPPPAPSLPPAAAPEAGVPTPAQTVADGSAFPVAGAHSFGNSENRFGAPRGGHVHEGQDVLSAEGTPVLAPMAGTIESTSYQAGGAGYYVVEHTSVGFDFFFAHCQLGSFAVAAAEAVAVGQLLCHAGQTRRRDRARTCTSRCGSAAGRPRRAPDRPAALPRSVGTGRR